jgi:hypothetical protein
MVAASAKVSNLIFVSVCSILCAPKPPPQKQQALCHGRDFRNAVVIQKKKRVCGVWRSAKIAKIGMRMTKLMSAQDLRAGHYRNYS